ncbi:MAG: ribonucleoside-diphosphate reductase subunit alpha [Cyanobacteria bacterium P01_H01_bin.74]
MSPVTVRRRDGSIEPIHEEKINAVIQDACAGVEQVSWSDVALGCRLAWYNGITTDEIDESAILSARSLIEKHPNYAYVAARLVLRVLYQQVLGAVETRRQDIQALYEAQFAAYLQKGVDENLLDSRLLDFDLDKLAKALNANGDKQFQMQGIQILKDRYFIRDRKQNLIELPQWMWMRVAMGLSLEEDNREERAIEFYKVMSNFDYIPSTPTLFSSGSVRSQLSSCFLNTVEDSIDGIFKTYADNAQLSKWSGGIGTDWTPVRATGSDIKGTNGKSQGLIPWLKIDNDVAIAVNQGGKRKGAHCVYLETWHLDIEDFLELRKNVGDERRRTHDINTANWIPDLFMQRVQANSHWTLFSPDAVPELHEVYGLAFESAYEKREQEFEAGLIQGKRIEAKGLWRKMLTMLFETGHPWITFKDACNVRSPQDHVGVVHSSNLCTEITLNTSTSETAVCNLGSVNLSRHFNGEKINYDKLKQTITTAVRMLDNVIDINYYPTVEAERANLQHRAVGMGVMGYQELLYELDIPFASEAHLEQADVLFEHISFYAISASNALAKERGAYPSFQGSKWSKGIFPLDTIDQLEKERGQAIICNRVSRLDWETLRTQVKTTGLRNSNMMAIAPTATIANIVGTTPCIEPTFKNLYVNSNLSGEFTLINPWMIRDMERLNLWGEEMANALKVSDGKLSQLRHLPEQLVSKYPDIFEIDQQWLIKAAAIRGKWIDQAQSLNLFVAHPSGKFLHELYILAWNAGLKTTYYLRTLGASQIEKSTVDQGKYGKTHTRGKTANGKMELVSAEAESCQIDDPDCEACQ